MLQVSTTAQKYAHFWKKYRPAILKLMVDSAEGPQSYKFTKHEFDDANPKKAGGYAFNIRVFNGRVLAKTGNVVAANDLYVMLLQSNKGTELTTADIFEFTLDREFNLHIKQEAPPQEAKAEEEESSAEESTDQEQSPEEESETASEEGGSEDSDSTEEDGKEENKEEDDKEKAAK